MKPSAIFGVVVAAALAAPLARADYALLRSGLRLHVAGYERRGDRVLLAVTGGEVDIAAGDLASIEPEDTFQPAPAAPQAPYGDLVRAAAQKHGVDEKLIRRVIAAESNFNPQAVSRKQALGLMQLLPKTAAHYAVANAFDPAANIDAGTRYLKELLTRYRGDVRLALAAYNAGPEMVDRYGGVPPFRETRHYVQQILATLAADSPSTPRR